ncbi:MAG: formate dehydrogenase [Deltaproteobacteria bacterium]|nr:formate dehydrogenase [Deltaproteobacteria bacterium]
MADKSFFIDTTRCTACRGCQIACKQWNNLPAERTTNWGSFQNPADLSHSTFKLVRFSEVDAGGKVNWYFFPDQCRHCIDPPCKDAAEAYLNEAVVIDGATGAVVYTEKTRELSAEAFKEVRAACPYDIPRRNDATGLITKCTMCFDRVHHGLLPACVKACCTGALSFGDRPAMLEAARRRVEELKGKGYAKAQILDADSVRAIFLVIDDPKSYHPFATARAEMGKRRKLALPRLFRGGAGLIAGTYLVGSLMDSCGSE